MDVTFPDTPQFKGWGEPLRAETDVRDLELIHGAVPRELNGVLYRCGPDHQYPPLSTEDVPIDGEGMVHRFHFIEGHVDYRSRWVRNERFLLQQRARRALFGRYRNPFTDDPDAAGRNRGTANMNVVWHGKRLLALDQISLPVELDPVTLEVRGEWNGDGRVEARSLTARPKLDMRTNELHWYSCQAQGEGSLDFVFYTADLNGRIVHHVWFEMPYAALVHDFAVTDHHVIVPFFPLITDPTVLKRGGPCCLWHPERHSHFAVFPRRGIANSVRWFHGPAVSGTHVMNAFEDGSQIHVDLCLYQGNCYKFVPTYDGSPFEPSTPRLTRVTLDLAGRHDGYEAHALAPMPLEMPVCDGRFMGKPYRFGFAVCRPTIPVPDAGLSAVACWDHANGTLTMWDPGPNCSVHEPTLAVPPGAPEAEGYLLVLVNRLDAKRTDLAILNARRLMDGPLAVFKLPLRMRSTLHGMWVPVEALATGKYGA
ncbi:MAG: carotenoid oxygenase family protein [Steroidobacteraceae bacterium]|nr:carotenoid oxygenase family protein [Steroidobacteraceae bacterium]